MKTLTLTAWCLGLFLAPWAQAQEVSFTLCAIDRADSAAIPGAEARVASAADTTLVYTGEDGCAAVAVPTETAAEPPAGMPGAFRIEGSHPSPFARRAAVTYELAHSGLVRACLFDVLGRRRACSEPAHLQPGRHEATVEGGGLAPGLYALRLGGESGSASAVLVKAGGPAGGPVGVALRGGTASPPALAAAGLRAAGEAQEATSLSFRVRKDTYIERTLTETVSEGDTVHVVLTAEADEDQVTYVVPEQQTVYAIGAETGRVTEVVDSAGYQIRWSPDGRRLAFRALYQEYEAHQIFVMNVDGTGRRVVTLWENDGQIEPRPFDTNSDPVWSPEGDRIAYTRCRNCEMGGGNFEVFIVDLDMTEGVREVRLTNNLVGDYAQDWSPDGEKILFESSYASDGSWDRSYDTYEINIDGSDRQRILVNDSTHTRHGARYSPDGTRIAFIAQPAGSPREIYIANRDGSGQRQVTSNDLREYYLSWSPDGTRLAFTTGSGYSQSREHLYIVNTDGSGERRITTEGAAYTIPEWRPRLPSGETP